MVDTARANNIVPLLVTMGHGPLHNSLARNNQNTREIAREKDVLLVDFERVAKPSYFTEDNVYIFRPGNAAMIRTIVRKFARSGFEFVPREETN